MAARAPRRTFARPFVVTLAAVPACYVNTTPAPSGPPPQQQPAPPPPSEEPGPPPPTVVSNPPRPTPPPDQSPQQQPPRVIANPPPPPPPPPPPQDNTSWSVHKTADGCVAIVKVECPKGTPGHPMPTCNPPPPIKYACPENVSLDHPITVVSSGGSCYVEPEPVQCPPRVACNPPRPRPVPCPHR